MPVSSPAYRCKRWSTPSGAGDGFAVGMISALLENHSFAEAVKRANWIGSRAVQSRGTWRGCRPGQKCPLNLTAAFAGKPAMRPAQSLKI